MPRSNPEYQGWMRPFLPKGEPCEVPREICIECPRTGSEEFLEWRGGDRVGDVADEAAIRLGLPSDAVWQLASPDGEIYHREVLMKDLPLWTYTLWEIAGAV